MTMQMDRRLAVGETTSSRRRRPANLIFRHDIGDSWAKMGIAWLFQRDLDFMQQNTSFVHSRFDMDIERRPVPIFDTVKALVDVGANGSPRDTFLAHQCAGPVVPSNKSDMDYMNYLSLLLDLDYSLDYPRVKGLPIYSLASHNTLCFHLKIADSQQLEVAPQSLIELCASTTRNLFAHSAKPLVETWLLPRSPLSYFNFGHHPEGQEHLLDILKNYFRKAAKYHPKPEDAGKTTYLSRVGADFILESAYALHKLQPSSPLFSRHENLFQFLATNLQDIHDDLAAHPAPTGSCLFFASSLYIDWFLRTWRVPEIIKTDMARNLILTILRYHARVTQLQINTGFCDTIGFGLRYDGWPRFVRYAKELGVVLPPPAEQPPIDSPPLEGADIQEESSQRSGDSIVDVRANPLGEQALQDNRDAFAHSPLKTDENDSTA